MTDITLPQITKHVNAVVELPGSKSIANRVLLMAALADGTSIIRNVPNVSEDVRLMLDALSTLGIVISKLDDESANTHSSSYKIVGCNGAWPIKTATLFCGNSGTSIRFLTAALALSSGQYTLTGIERMKERPINDLLQALSTLGSQIVCLEKSGYPPITVGNFLDSKVNEVELNATVSSQYVTAMLMALPILHREIKLQLTTLPISEPYIAITVALLNLFGCKVTTVHNNGYMVSASSGLVATNYVVEPDASSASYFLALGALRGAITVKNLHNNSLQGDKDFAHVLEQMGAVVSYGQDFIQVKSCATERLNAININMEAMPDVAMTIAVLCLFATGTSTITGIRSWRVKETDRINAMATELTKLGAIVIHTDDSITITPPQQIISDVHIDTYNDHRMAMCFSLVAAMGVSIVIKDYECVGKTFANYFDLFQSICYTRCL